MIWLLSNLWWIGTIAVLALCLLHPAGWALARAVPVRVWAAIAFVALLGAAFQSGRFYERSVQREADKTLDAKAGGVVKESKERAKGVADKVTKGTADVAAKVRTEIRYLPATCPAVPASVRESIQQQVEAARAGMPKPARIPNS